MSYERERNLTIGIDVGGTNTDGVLFDAGCDEILSFVKTPTDHRDYGRSVENALDALLRDAAPDEIRSLNISTTLSTNALLEGKGSPVALLLIGYDDFPHIKEEILRVIKPAALLCADGGHNGWGKERHPLDVESVSHFAKENIGAYFAVSSIYSPRNPEHESTAAKVIKRIGCAGVTCGHEMSHSHLNSVKRTITAFLNSSLTDMTRRLIDGIASCADSHGLKCPTMFVRSDGSLVCADWCARYPLETIFSGPAAGIRGAIRLAKVGTEDAVIADIGGTSTDIGIVKKGEPLYSESGASIGEYRTMIPSLEIRSVALGGDSEVRVAGDNKILLGPERVIPVCRGIESRGLERIGITPTDALAASGLTGIGDKDAALRALSEYAEKTKETEAELAKRICEETSSRLREEIFKAIGKNADMKRICVGAPAASFADAKECFVPDGAAITGAVGAAVSSLGLSCSVYVKHNFFDGEYYAFLPTKRIKGSDFNEVCDEARRELKEHLKKQAALMGFKESTAEITESIEYADKECSVADSVLLSGRAVI